jgi:hypothetical protein
MLVRTLRGSLTPQVKDTAKQVCVCVYVDRAQIIETLLLSLYFIQNCIVFFLIQNNFFFEGRMANETKNEYHRAVITVSRMLR